MKHIKVLALLNRRELREKAEQIAAELSGRGFLVESDPEHTIGRRIGRAEQHGEVPVIVDFDTLEDGKVVIYRSDKTGVAANFRTDISDSKGKAERVTIDELVALMPKL